jgi:lipopolysaccharide cholinephosphotransferase
MSTQSFSFQKVKTREKALAFLFEIVDTLDHHGITYALEGGTLLGIVRDNQLLPWDHDIDLSVNGPHTPQLLGLKWHFLRMGYKCSFRKSQENTGPFKKNDLTIVKIKPFWPYLFKAVAPWWKSDLIVCDIFIKQPLDGHYYWQAMNKTMRVPEEHYNTTDTIPFMNRFLKLPGNHRQYLTEKYGNWLVPIKDWNCGTDEKSIWKGQK